MKESRECKVLDIREFRKNEDCLYHIILEDLNSHERFDLRVIEKNLIDYYENRYGIDSYGHNLLIKGDIVGIIYEKEFDYVEFRILENESEV